MNVFTFVLYSAKKPLLKQFKAECMEDAIQEWTKDVIDTFKCENLKIEEKPVVLNNSVNCWCLFFKIADDYPALVYIIKTVPEVKVPVREG